MYVIIGISRIVLNQVRQLDFIMIYIGKINRNVIYAVCATHRAKVFTQ